MNMQQVIVEYIPFFRLARKKVSSDVCIVLNDVVKMLNRELDFGLSGVSYARRSTPAVRAITYQTSTSRVGVTHSNHSICRTMPPFHFR